MWIKIVIKYGIWFFVGLMAYYLLMQVLGFSDRFDFRILNALIQIVVVYLAIRTYAHTNREDFNYLSGTVIGVNTSIVGLIPFAIFQMINLYLNPSLVETIREIAPVVGPYINPLTGGLIVFSEGLVVGLVLSYICMRVVDHQVNSENHENLTDRSSGNPLETQSRKFQ